MHDADDQEQISFLRLIGELADKDDNFLRLLEWINVIDGKVLINFYELVPFLTDSYNLEKVQQKILEIENEES